ncbi:hypothetical protein IMZ48_06865 [Candidatus Bathyarchaeota archaeon]|nr:hypothetical protein [Candidatus Bathyarchaeota archaeon]
MWLRSDADVPPVWDHAPFLPPCRFPGTPPLFVQSSVMTSFRLGYGTGRWQRSGRGGRGLTPGGGM